MASEENLMASEAVSEDALLDGRLKLRQPKHGYRVAIDPVFLAAAVPAGAGEKVLDAGAGSGAAALCLARRVPGCHVAGIEIGRDMVRLAAENIALNGLGGRVEVVVGDIVRPPPGLGPGSFAHVMANPPHLEAGRATPSPDPGRARARVEGGADLGAWVGFCLAMVRSGGSVTFIHRADRLDALLAELHGRAGGIVVFPLWPGGRGGPAKRVLVRGCKDVHAPTRLVPGLVLHRADGAYTQAAEAVLRHGAALELQEAWKAPTRLVPGLVLHRADGAYTRAAEAVLRRGAALELQKVPGGAHAGRAAVAPAAGRACRRACPRAGCCIQSRRTRAR